MPNRQNSNTFDEVLDEVFEGKYDSLYSEFIMNNCGGDRIINNGDALLVAMEQNYLIEDFANNLYNNILGGIAA
jgi:hypothetical protein